MLDYITSLLPRLQQFSKGLNDTAIFADVPWVFIDGDGDRVTYIFRRNNELLVSKQGEVTTGHWEYLAAMQSLLIEHGNRKRMYNQGFVDNVVMALRKDGTEELFLLANQQALPDLDAVKYLERKATVEKPILETPKKTKTKNNVEVRLTKPNRLAIIQVNSNQLPFSIGNYIYSKNGEPLPDSEYYTSGLKLNVKDGQIISCSGYLSNTAILVLVILILTGISFIVGLFEQ